MSLNSEKENQFVTDLCKEKAGVGDQELGTVVAWKHMCRLGLQRNVTNAEVWVWQDGTQLGEKGTICGKNK